MFKNKVTKTGKNCVGPKGFTVGPKALEGGKNAAPRAAFFLVVLKIEKHITSYLPYLQRAHEGGQLCPGFS